jgi:tetratricopeptide (TPR) repeat protein
MSEDGLRDAAATGWAAAAREDPGPTVAYFSALLERHPASALALYHLARANDYAGDPAVAAPLYERAFAAGLSGDELRRGLTSYGSTLRNLGRAPEAVAVLARAVADFPADPLLRCYLALALHSSGQPAHALATMLELALAQLADPELQANRWALANYAAALRNGTWSPDGGAALNIATPTAT